MKKRKTTLRHCAGRAKYGKVLAGLVDELLNAWIRYFLEIDSER